MLNLKERKMVLQIFLLCYRNIFKIMLAFWQTEDALRVVLLRGTS